MVTRKLNKHGLKTDKSTYVIAEIGINHGGDLDMAKRLIDSAARSGVDAVKFQTYLTEKRAPKNNKEIFDILKKCELPFDAFIELKEHSDNLGVEFFSTAFDEESVDFLNDLGCDIFKIASFDVTNHKLLRKVAKTKKSVILSVGMSNMEEITEAYKILKESAANVILLHCISAYPTREEDANLGAIQTLKHKFDCVVGQSDHTNDIFVPLCAVAAGAQVIEKHFKINKQMECVDSPVSITEEQTREMVLQIRRIENAFGSGIVAPTPPQKPAEGFRRFSK